MASELMKRRWGLVFVDILFLLYWALIAVAAVGFSILRGGSVWDADPARLWVACFAGAVLFCAGCWIVVILHRRKPGVYWFVTVVLAVPFLLLLGRCCLLPFTATPFYTDSEIRRNCFLALLCMGAPVLYMLRPSIRNEFKETSS